MAVGEKYTPLGLLKITCPLALMRPKIWLGELPVMRLSSTLLDDGWAMLTWACEPTSKRFQLITARWLVWVTSITALFAPTLIAAWPATTTPPFK